ncbi:serine--tRNA ligase-like [Amphiura filiformis]|uniref:serine--tRNA ligase-like n=1 Tax=Amphiura filiformis TaxID=82378 RepID=UPI003B2279D3
MFATRFATKRVIWSSQSIRQKWNNRSTKLRLFPSTSPIENSAEFNNIEIQLNNCHTCTCVSHHKSLKSENFLKRRVNFAAFHRRYSSYLFTPSAEGEHAAFIMKPEIDFETLRIKMKEMEDSVKFRSMDVNVEVVISMWDEIQQMEEQKKQLENERKKIKFRKGDKVSDEDMKKAKAQGRALREELRTVNSRISELTDQLYPMALRLPNFLHGDVPLGTDPVELESFTGHGGELKTVRFGKQESHELAHPGFVYLEDEGALLEQALLRWAAHQLNKKGFIRFSSPDKFKPIALEALGLDPDGTNQTYAVKTNEDSTYLTGASPIAFAAYFMMTVVDATNLPQRCYTVGKHYNSKNDTGRFDGFHNSFQTNKVEVCGLSEESIATSDMIFRQYVSLLKDLYSELPLKCRLLEIPSSQLLPSMYRKCTLEIWLPKTAEYVEAASVYSCTDYISRRLKIRHIGEGEDLTKHKSNRRFVHTVHGQFIDTGVLIEAFQQLAEDTNEMCIPGTIMSYMPKHSKMSLCNR